MATFLASLFIGIDIGLAVGVGVALAFLFSSLAAMGVQPLVKVPHTDDYRYAAEVAHYFGTLFWELDIIPPSPPSLMRTQSNAKYYLALCSLLPIEGRSEEGVGIAQQGLCQLRQSYLPQASKSPGVTTTAPSWRSSAISPKCCHKMQTWRASKSLTVAMQNWRWQRNL